MPILNQNEIQSLFARYNVIREFILNQNEGQPNNQRIKQVQLPSNLSESIIFHYIVANPDVIGENKIIEDQLIQGNSRTFDLTYNNRINIEVKATGTNIFQRFRPHALTTNYIFWLNITGNNTYNIARFNPNILIPNNRGEVDITWNNLIGINGVQITQEIIIPL